MIFRQTIIREQELTIKIAYLKIFQGLRWEDPLWNPSYLIICYVVRFRLILQAALVTADVIQ